MFLVASCSAADPTVTEYKCQHRCVTWLVQPAELNTDLAIASHLVITKIHTCGTGEEGRAGVEWEGEG